ncbi:MAG: AmmeMemoRadiSam system protein B [Candidatus Krumholzibacteriota bacterium]|nr:AmmeMemoRadiSam system protein B [Candidatus Krumholzibacteriota bacterium]
MKSLKAILTLSALIVIFTGAAFSGRKGDPMKDHTRSPAVAGQFYPDDPAKLRSMIENMLSNASSKKVKGRIRAIVAPHAGYVYSGHVAAEAYSLLGPRYAGTVIVISPCHVDHFPYASIFTGSSYTTPLGNIEINEELSEMIASKTEAVRRDDRGHTSRAGGRGEHSLEVQLPFLQVVIGEFRLVPIVMGDQSTALIESLGKAIGESIKGEDVLIVASTDLSHFHPADHANILDEAFIKALMEFDHESVIASIVSDRSEACGAGPVAAAIIASKTAGADRCEIVNYANSGDISGDYSSVVGYLSALFIDDTSIKESSSDIRAASSNEDDISREDRLFLLRYARRVIEDRLSGKETDDDIPDSRVLGEKRGGFVTLKKRGQLRGCIGYIEAIKPLAETVAEMAASAAFNDTRFNPVSKEELDDIAIEISVLSPVRKIDDPSIIVVGKHGIIITRGRNRGLLLPQVATEWKWDRETFLSQTCVKAGLDPDAWKLEGTLIEIFSAEIFSEEELGLR